MATVEDKDLGSTDDELRSLELQQSNHCDVSDDPEKQKFLPTPATKCVDAEHETEENTDHTPGDSANRCDAEDITVEVGSSSLQLQTALETLEAQKPRDRFRLVYIIMVIHGIGILMPWNMFINAKSYFEEYKLNQGSQATDVVEYRTNFMAYIGMASQYPNAITSFLNLFCQCKGKPRFRIIGSLIIIIFVFLITIILAMVDSSEWPELFFWITMFSAVIFNSAGGIYQNSLYGVVAILPMTYTNAVIFGNNFSGTFVACLRIIVLALAPDAKTSALYYFVTAVVILLIALDAYFVLPSTKFFRHYQKLTKLKQAQTARASRSQHNSLTSRMLLYWHVFKQIWVLALSVWFVFFVSLALFPQIQSDIKRADIHFNDLYWTPVFCFLSFNLCAMLGNLLTGIMTFPGPRFVWIPVLLRAVFIPLFLMFNFRPDNRSWKAPLANDYVYIFSSMLMAFTSGYFSSLCMMFAPAKVERQNAGLAGMMMSVFLVVGILTGVNASRVLVTFVSVESAP